MKKPRESKKEVDLTTLLDPSELMSDVPADDCFGSLWDPQEADCAICADVEICGIVKQADTKKKVTKLEDKKGPFLDMTAFDKVPVDQMVKSMKQYAADGDPFTYDELTIEIGEVAQTKDQVAIREYIKSLLPRYSLTITEDKTIVPYESTDINSKAKYPA